MKTSANARASGPAGPFYRRWIDRFAAIDDGNILRVAFFVMLAGTAAVLFVDYRELTASAVASPAMPLAPILPPALDGPDARPMPAITADPQVLRQPLQIELGSGGLLHLTGTIDPGAAGRFADEIAARGEYVTRVVLDSPGGSVGDALTMADLIHDRGLATQVEAGALCASSCPIIFAAGKTRRASPEAAIGVHQIYAATMAGAAPPGANATALAMSDAQSLTARIITGLSRSGVDPALWLHALETPPQRLYYLSPSEMLGLNLVTTMLQN